MSNELFEKKLNIFRKIWNAYQQLPKRNLVSIMVDSNNLDEERALAAAVCHHKEGISVDEYDDFPFYEALDESEIYDLASEISSTLKQIATFIHKVAAEDMFEILTECELVSSQYDIFLQEHQDDEWV